MSDSAVKQKIVDKIKDSSNILVTVSSSPSVDELSAALGLTLLLNKLDKHATAVFSGDIPPAIAFLEPEKTFENTVDSLRDFIIALDKSKADHLRYKVEGDLVRIFITPYRTTLTQDDLDFSQGDYNVDTVLALGVKNESELDSALSAHGRILHDATVAVLSTEKGNGELGTMNWNDDSMSSYAEMAMGIIDGLKSNKNLLDEQIATALLTGIVSATERFSNSKTNSRVMTISAQLMSAGANQQLIATKLEAANDFPKEKDDSDDNKTDDSNLKIDRENETKKQDSPEPEEKPSDGSLTIDHDKASADEIAEPKHDTLDEVAAATVAKQQEEATKQAEEELAEHLAASGTPPAEPKPLRGAVPADQWKKTEAVPIEENSEPSLGGTLNATTEQAAIDKQRELEDDRNKTILSHGNSPRKYITEEPTMQSPLSASAEGPEDESLKDIFSAAPSTANTGTIEPPKPSAPAPTLAEIEAQNNVQHAEARQAISDAYALEPQAAPAAAPSPEPSMAPVQNGLPPLPPMPPLPDFSTLPPLPEGLAPQPALTPALHQQNPAPAPATATGANDPAQFKIPGQA